MALSKVFQSRIILSELKRFSSVSVRLYCKKKDSTSDMTITQKDKGKIKSKPISTEKLFAQKQTQEDSEGEIRVSISDKPENSQDKTQDERVVILNTERGKDANLRSKLSKEYDQLIKKKISLASTGLNLSVEIDKEKPLYDIPSIPIPKIKHEIDKTPFKPEIDIKIEQEPTLSERPVRQEPGKVILGIIPEEWLHFFLPKTGVTGFYTFVFTFGTFLVSKEIYVLEHEFYNGLAMIITWLGFVKYVGPAFAKYFDKEIDEYENMWIKSREDEKKNFVDAIEDEGFAQYQMEGNALLIDAKRENIALQLEEEFRKRHMTVYEEVKKRLDYQVEIAYVHKRIHHKNLIDYVFNEVQKSITPDLHSKLINYSINQLVNELKKEDEKK